MHLFYIMIYTTNGKWVIAIVSDVAIHEVSGA